MTKELFYVALGGGCGAALRYGISLWAARRWSAFPCGTLLVNVLGCFLIGFFMAIAVRRSALPLLLRPFFVSGLLGGLTTFSTFSYESLQLFLSGNTMQGLMNIVVNVLLCLATTFAGLLLGRFAVL